ncbi:MAG: tetratricopeptide repeat-containing sensor histidine kinase [Verrucomicrobiota bacterium]|nr:tetratricopeptide repeat-containing sensor histidine kinase [Verrucomicrobiota bacterium]
MNTAAQVIDSLWEAVTRWEDAGVKCPGDALTELKALLAEGVRQLQLGVLPELKGDNLLIAVAFQEFWGDEAVHKQLPHSGVIAFASLLTLCGQCATRLSAYHHALVYLRSAADLHALYYERQPTEASLGEAATRNELALLFAERGDVPQARKEMDTARFLAEQSRLPKLIGRILRTQGLLHLYLTDERDRSQALPCFEKSRALAESAGDRVGQALALNNSGGCYIEMERYDEAVGPLIESAAIARAYGYSHLLASILSNLALAYSQIKRPEEALEISHEALRLRQEQGAQLGTLISILNLGTLVYEHPNLHKHETVVWPTLSLELRQQYANSPGFAYMVHANRELGTIPSSRFHAVFATELARFAKKAGNHALALEYMELASRRQQVESREFTANLRNFFELEMHLERARHDAILYRVRHGELLKVKEALERVNDERSALMWTLAHDLRNAVSTIIGRGEILGCQCDQMDPNHADHIRNIVRSGRWIADFLNKTLSLEAIESGHYPIELKSLPIAVIIRDTLRRHEPAVQQQGVVLDAATVESDALVLADETAITQMLDNYILNAFKHSPRGTTIRLETSISPTTVEFRVIDQGEGIAPEHNDRLFRKFTRLDSTHLANTSGKSFGLGLAITKALADAMDGHVGCRSIPGQGSNFWFTLPRAD